MNDLVKNFISKVYVKYLDDDEFDKGVEMRIFPSLEVLIIEDLPNLERSFKVEREVVESGKRGDEIFPCISILKTIHCPKIELFCLPCVKDLKVFGCNNEILKSIFILYGLTTRFP